MNPGTPLSIAGAGSGYSVLGGQAGFSGTYIGSAHEFNEGFDIRVTPAAGGFVVSVDHRVPGKRAELHIVTDDKDLGVEIGKIITSSFLKKE